MIQEGHRKFLDFGVWSNSDDVFLQESCLAKAGQEIAQEGIQGWEQC